MLRIFLASHGRLASGMKSALAVLSGENERLYVFDAYVKEDSLEDALDAFYEDVEKGDKVLLLSDLYGGSVDNAMRQFLGREDTRLVAGINMAFLLQIMMLDDIDHYDLSEIIEESRMGLREVLKK